MILFLEEQLLPNGDCIEAKPLGEFEYCDFIESYIKIAPRDGPKFFRSRARAISVTSALLRITSCFLIISEVRHGNMH